MAQSDPTSVALQGCLEACRRCESLVDRVTRTGASAADRAYAAIGPHLRHCLDHFTCLLRGLGSGLVDYDARERDGGLERDPRRFRAVLATVVERLQALDPAAGAAPLQVRQAAAPGGHAVVVGSSVERELVFLSGHTIHHLAMMKMLASAHGVLLPEHVDLAFSTEAHLERVD